MKYWEYHPGSCEYLIYWAVLYETANNIDIGDSEEESTFSHLIFLFILYCYSIFIAIFTVVPLKIAIDVGVDFVPIFVGRTSN